MSDGNRRAQPSSRTHGLPTQQETIANLAEAVRGLSFSATEEQRAASQRSGRPSPPPAKAAPRAPFRGLAPALVDTSVATPAAAVEQAVAGAEPQDAELKEVLGLPPDASSADLVTALARDIKPPSGPRTVTRTETTTERTVPVETEESLTARTLREEAEAALVQAKADVATAKLDASTAVAKHMETTSAELDRQATEQADRRAREARVVQRLLLEKRQVMERFSKAGVDPNRALGEPGSARRIGLSLVAALGSIGADLMTLATRQPHTNHALGIINDSIDRDIAAQERALVEGRQNINSLGQEIEEYRSLFGDNELAREAAKAAMLERHKVELTRIVTESEGKVEQANQLELLRALELELAQRDEQFQQAAAGVVSERSTTKQLPGGRGMSKAEALEWLINMRGKNAELDERLSKGSVSLSEQKLLYKAQKEIGEYEQLDFILQEYETALRNNDFSIVGRNLRRALGPLEFALPKGFDLKELKTEEQLLELVARLVGREMEVRVTDFDAASYKRVLAAGRLASTEARLQMVSGFRQLNNAGKRRIYAGLGPRLLPEMTRQQAITSPLIDQLMRTANAGGDDGVDFRPAVSE